MKSLDAKWEASHTGCRTSRTRPPDPTAREHPCGPPVPGQPGPPNHGVTIPVRDRGLCNHSYFEGGAQRGIGAGGVVVSKELSSRHDSVMPWRLCRYAAPHRHDIQTLSPGAQGRQFLGDMGLFHVRPRTALSREPPLSRSAPSPIGRAYSLARPRQGRIPNPTAFRSHDLAPSTLLGDKAAASTGSLSRKHAILQESTLDTSYPSRGSPARPAPRNPPRKANRTPVTKDSIHASRRSHPGTSHALATQGTRRRLLTRPPKNYESGSGARVTSAPHIGVTSACSRERRRCDEDGRTRTDGVDDDDATT